MRLSGTELTVEVDQAGVYFWMWSGAALAWTAVSVLTGVGALGAGAWLLSMAAAPPLLARPFFRRAAERERRRMEPLIMELLRTIEDR